MGWMAGVLFPARAKYFSLLYSVQTASGTLDLSSGIKPGIKLQVPPPLNHGMEPN
jgi:hypothetical protein